MYKINNLNLEQYQSIILQFSSTEVNVGVKIHQQLSSIYPEKKFYLLADHLHSPCCVDVVGAMHIKHDMIIHFGEACFSEKPGYIYVLPSEEFDLIYVQEQIDNVQESCYLLSEQCFDLAQLKGHIPLSNQQNTHSLGCGYFANALAKNLIFIGNQENKLFEKFIQQFSSNHFTNIYICNPRTKEFLKYQENCMGLIMKRHKQIEEIHNCETFGLLINNPSASYTQTVWNKCKLVLKANNKKYFSFSMNQLNEPKLGNFPEVQAYVIISCFNNTIIDTKQFYKLVITPWQLLQAFTGEIEYNVNSDIRNFNIDKQDMQIQEKNDNLEDRLILNQGTIIPLNEIFSTLDFQKERKYQGLEIRNNIPPVKIELGLSGIASIYTNE